MRLLLSILFLFFVFSFFSSLTFAQTIPTVGANLSTYSAPTGAQCAINVPSQYTTIQAGINAANPGDTVCVASGTYNEDIVISKSITLAGRGSGNTTINGQGGNYSIYGVSTVVIPNAAPSNITIEGFKIIGVGTAYTDAAVLLLGNSSNAIFQFNHIVSGNGARAFYVQWARSNDTIQNNILEGNNAYQVASFTHDALVDNEQIINNTFSGTVAQTAQGDSGVVMKFGGRNSLISKNAFNTTGTVSEVMQVAYTPNVVSENNFNSVPSTGRRLRLSGGNAVLLNAENNWWGTTNPTSTEVAGDVDYDPFASTPFPEYSLNQDPEVGVITAPTTPVQVNTAISASANFTDQNTLDTHTASWDWGDGTVTSGTITESNGAGSVSGSHTYTIAGVYTITLTVTDNNGGIGTSTFQYVSVYNPTPQGLFTGNRTFTSPVGAFPQNPTLSGQVQFGVTSKYQNGSLIGDVSMNFKAANFEFDSTALTLLVTSNGQATLRGTGTINQSGSYNFLVTGLDGLQDYVRIQIKDQLGTVMYDSQLGADDTATPNTSIKGQIIVH